MRAYMYYKGLLKLSKQLKGDENIYLGIRPYGFHAGNMVPFVVYPNMLCEELLKKGIKPKFNFFIFINDWEQDKLDGPDPINYPFNIYPSKTTFQHVYISKNKKMNIVDKWEPVILKSVSDLKRKYKNISVKTVRNSSLRENPIMKKYLLRTISNSEGIAEILRKRTKKKILNDPLTYAIAVCPKCKFVGGKTTIVKDDYLNHYCKYCGKNYQDSYHKFDYWFYHKPSAIPRIEIFNIDLCITGADHFMEGDFKIRKDLIKFFNAKINNLKVLYTPVVIGYNGEKMGKSKKNDVVISPEKLRKMLEKNKYSDVLRINEKP